MSYCETLQRIFSRLPRKGGYADISRIERAAALLGNPQERFRSIHVTGSNGKGTVCWKLASALQAAGLKVGLFTGPHISSYRERIRVDREMIAEQEVVDLTGRVQALSFFDVSVLTAFLHFAARGVHVAVVEVGIGGRLDPTNVLPPPLLAVLTSVSLEHTDYLGDTVEAICREKCGIVKPGTPVVVGPSVPLGVVLARAADTRSEVLRVHDKAGRDFEAENEDTVRLALARLRLDPAVGPALVPDDVRARPHRFVAADPNVEAALKSLDRCRFEVHTADELRTRGHPYAPSALVFDVGHNPGALEAFFRRLTTTFPGRPLHVLLGMSYNKDTRASAAILLRHAASVHLVPVAHFRLATSSRLRDDLEAARGPGQGPCPVHFYGDREPERVEAAVQGCVAAAAADGGVVCVSGSFFIMSPVRRVLGFDDPTDPVF